MLSIVLEFDVKDGMESEFRELWKETTDYIYQNFGSLGSRLHKSNNGKFIAYAQWPDVSTYDEEHVWSGPFLEIRNKMRVTLKQGKPTILHKLILDTDLLKTEQYER